jgi:hypothetical protein
MKLSFSTHQQGEEPMSDTAPVTDNQPVLKDFDADHRALVGFGYPWFTVEACEVIAPLREQLRAVEAIR